MRMGHGRGRSRRRRRQASVWQFASASRFAERDAQYAERRGVCVAWSVVWLVRCTAIARNINIHLCVYGYTRKHKHEQNVLYMSPVSFQSTSRIAAHAEKMGLRLRAVP